MKIIFLIAVFDSLLLLKIVATASPNDFSDKISAWNCDLKDTLQFAEYSLMEVSTCSNVSSQYSNPTIVNGQLIQARKYQDISVLSCSLQASFFTAYCSYNLLSGSRLWDSQGKLMNVQLELTRSECEGALSSNVLRYSDRTYYAKQNLLSIDLSPTHTANGWLTLRGQSFPTQGTCVPETFQLGRQTYKSHVLQMKYAVNIKWSRAVFNTAKRLIRVDKHTLLPNTLTGSFFHPDLGNFHWDKMPDGNLSDNSWLEVTRGRVQIYFPDSINSSMPIAIIQAHESSSNLAFSLYNQSTICLSFSCRRAYETRLKDIYLILYNIQGQSHWPLELVTGSEINRLQNLEASLASIYLSRELALSSTFEKISRALCERNREIILSNIHDYIGNILIKQDAQNLDTRLFLRAGSTLYAVRCQEQQAWLRSNTTECYTDAPIYYLNSNKQKIGAFLDPISYVIRPSSTIVQCNDILPFKFNFLSLDGTNQWICRNSQGWDIDCSPPQILSPLHPGKLYKPQDKRISPNLYSKEQLSSLDKMQWMASQQEIDIKEWEHYLQQIKTRNPNLSTATYFENLKLAIDQVSYIFSENFWLQLAFKHFMPVILLNYLGSIIITVIKTILQATKIYKTTGLSVTLIIQIVFGTLTSVFPVFNSMPQPTPTCTCRCKDPNFIDQMVTAVEQRERQRFLSNLQL